VRVEKAIIARYGEVHLKGANRGFFLRLLTNNLVLAVGKHCKVKLENSRYIFTEFKEEITDFLVQRIAKVFGITSVSSCVVVPHDKILPYIKSLGLPGSGCTFKVEVNRADKTFPHTSIRTSLCENLATLRSERTSMGIENLVPLRSMEFAAICGEAILDKNPNARVDVHNPEKTIYIDIREGNTTYIYEEAVTAVGGMPVGSAGKALVMLSGGIDSPIAAFLAAKRGLTVDCIHFASPPYTSDMALDKIKRLRNKLTDYCNDIKVHVVPFTEIQEQIRDKCHPEYMITLMRRQMVRIAEKLGNADCIITGENLSQVASQTIHGITTNNICAKEVPILRPLITYDKKEITQLAKQVGTYDISIEPHMDCCTVFVPSKPVIKPTIERCEREERKLDVEGLIARAVDGIYVF